MQERVIGLVLLFRFTPLMECFGMVMTHLRRQKMVIRGPKPSAQTL
jgi:hypothetical protein